MRILLGCDAVGVMSEKAASLRHEAKERSMRSIGWLPEGIRLVEGMMHVCVVCIIDTGFL